MSYSLMDNQCNWCEKKDAEIPCQDSEKIREAISNIHMSNDGTHQGSGAIIIQCNKQISKMK